MKYNIACELVHLNVSSPFFLSNVESPQLGIRLTTEKYFIKSIYRKNALTVGRLKYGKHNVKR